MPRIAIAPFIVVSFLAWSIATPYLARRRVVRLCSSVKVGEPVAAVVIRAHRAGLRILPSYLDSNRVTMMDNFLLFRWFCTVHAEQGRVTDFELSYLD